MKVSAWSLGSPAKINWSLEVLGKRGDGFHELRSLFVAVDLHDELTLLPAEPGQPQLELHGLGATQLPRDARNLVLQAEQAWRAAGGEAPALRWRLHKQIPAAAGLGGGSGNAAAALRLLTRVATRQPQLDLRKLALELGSDLPFFLGNSPVWLGGRGELELQSLTPSPQRLVLLVPPISISTPEVFVALEAPPLRQNDPVEASRLPFSWPRPAGPNQLLPAVLKASPAFATFWGQLQEIAPFHLSGSGGACFLPLQEEEDGGAILSACHDLCEHAWVLACAGGSVLADPHPHTSS